MLIFTNSDDKNSRPTLWKEVNGIDQHNTETVASFSKAFS